MDPRVKKAAKILVDYSAKVKKNDYVQIITDYDANELALECYKLCIQRGAYPVVKLGLPGSSYVYYTNASDEQLKKFPEMAYYEIKKTDAVIYIGAPANTKELTNVDPKKMALRNKTTHKIQEYRVNNTKWVIYYYPNNSLAQDASMSLEEFTNFVFRSTNIDWQKESKKQDKLQAVLNKGKSVRIVAKNTDLTFSIKGMKAIKCDGAHNMPDGEVFTTPVKNSVNGKVSFSYPSSYQGTEVDNIVLVFKDGKVVNAKASKGLKTLQTALATDAGSSYLGEFGVGVNYSIKKYIKNTLFDEKIGGTIHLALGAAYKETNGKNKSAIHWDLVCDLRKGGKIIVDGKVIEENGKFKI
jgi:aminopeptidase